MSAERQYDPKHPEGLTTNQEILAGMLFDTKTIAPVTRRITNPDNTFSFEKIERATSPIDFAQDGEFALKLHETTPEAPLSPVYINLRNLPEELLDQVGVVLAETGGETPDLCAGIPKAGVPLAEAYSRHSGVQIAEIFEKEITEAGRKIVAGTYDQNQNRNLRIVDDLATKGHTKIEAIKAAEEMGFKITDIVVLVDRQQGAVQDLAEQGYTLRSAFTIDQLLQYGWRTKRISKEQYNQVRTYLGLV